MCKSHPNSFVLLMGCTTFQTYIYIKNKTENKTPPTYIPNPHNNYILQQLFNKSIINMHRKVNY